MRNLLLILLLVLGKWCFSQNEPVMKVNGANWVPLFSKSTYYIDSTNRKSVEEIRQNANQFIRWKKNNLELGRQPYAIWIHTHIKNVGAEQKYLLGVYSQLDSLYIYKKVKDSFLLQSFSDYSAPRKSRNWLQTRFHTTEISLKKGEVADIYMKIINRRHYNSIYADFTIPEDNLMWENGFYWEIGFIIGVIFIVIIFSMVIVFFTREKQFFIYALYLFLIGVLILQEEVFISIISNEFLYHILYRCNSIFFLLIAMGFNILLLTKISDIKNKNRNISRFLNVFFRVLILCGIIFCLIYYIYFSDLGFENQLYSVAWDFSIFLLILAVIIGTVLIFHYFRKNRMLFGGIIISVLYLIFNPVTYFFNYSKIFYFYEISHPNYFYYVLFLEIFVLGIAIAYNYRQIKSEHIRTIEDKLRLEEENRNIQELQDEKIKMNILESGNHLLKNLSKELHDDIGQKLSVINFSIENIRLKNPEDEQIKEVRSTIIEISNSLRDLSHWLNDFNFKDNNLVDILQNEIERLNKINIIQFNFEKQNHSDKNYETSLEENIILYRCFQECISNILRHADATQVDILLDYSEKITLKIKDNGKGFEVQNDIGNGIKNLKERTEIIDFCCKIASELKIGTEILIYKK